MYSSYLLPYSNSLSTVHWGCYSTLCVNALKLYTNQCKFIWVASHVFTYVKVQNATAGHIQLALFPGSLCSDEKLVQRGSLRMRLIFSLKWHLPITQLYHGYYYHGHVGYSTPSCTKRGHGLWYTSWQVTWYHTHLPHLLHLLPFTTEWTCPLTITRFRPTTQLVVASIQPLTLPMWC